MTGGVTFQPDMYDSDTFTQMKHTKNLHGVVQFPRMSSMKRRWYGQYIRLDPEFGKRKQKSMLSCS